MNSELKKRIELLNKGEIPKGYKKTEFGIFPSDWKTRQLDQLLGFKNGINADKDKYHSGVKMISVNDILTDRPIFYDSIQGQVDIDEDTLKEFGVSYGDILFQRSSETYEDAGKSNVYLDRDKISTYSGFVIRGKKKAEYEPYYLNEALRIDQVRKQIIRHAAGSQHINVGQDSLASVTIPFSTSQEQSKIAEILMKWDDAIKLQEQYTHILENRKRYIMKSIIAPKTDWHCEKLGKISNMYAGGTPSTEIAEYWNGEIPWIQSGLIQNNCIDIDDIDRRITEKGLNSSSTAWIRKDSVLVAITGATCANIAFLKCDATANQSVISITTDDLAPLFLYYYLQSVRKELLSLQNGSAQGGLTLKYLENFDVSFPDFAKQNKLANVLFAVDKEIELHKKKQNMLNNQRKALQQYLLNGIVRVNI